MAEAATIARPYAKAAFMSARDSKALADWSAALHAGAGLVADARIADLLSNPKLSDDQIVSMFAGLGGVGIDEHWQNFVRLLAAYKRLEVLPSISDQYEILRAQYEKEVDVQVTSAGGVTLFSQQFGMFSGGGMRSDQLDAGDMKLLEQLMDELPADDHQVPPPARRITVAVERNGAVTIRLYDRDHLPDEVMEMLRMTDARMTFTEHVFAPTHSWSRMEAEQSGVLPRQFVGHYAKNIGLTLAVSADGALFASQNFDK